MRPFPHGELLVLIHLTCGCAFLHCPDPTCRFAFALSAGAGPATPGSPGLQAALAVLADVHEAVEDAAGGLPEAQRVALCRGMLTAVGAAALARCLRADAGQAVHALPCLNALVSRHGLWRSRQKAGLACGHAGEAAGCVMGRAVGRSLAEAPEGRCGKLPLLACYQRADWSLSFSCCRTEALPCWCSRWPSVPWRRRPGSPTRRARCLLPPSFLSAAPG